MWYWRKALGGVSLANVTVFQFYITLELMCLSSLKTEYGVNEILTGVSGSHNQSLSRQHSLALMVLIPSSCLESHFLCISSPLLLRWGSLVKLCLISLNKHSTAVSVSHANPHKWFKCVTLVLVHWGFINTGSQRKDQANMPRMPSLFIKSIVREAN